MEQESESDYYASNDETDSEMVFEMDTNDMTDWLEENPKTAVKSVTCGPKVLKLVTEAVLEKKNPSKSKTVKTKSFSDKNTYNTVGKIKNKENVAIYANDYSDHIEIQ